VSDNNDSLHPVVYIVIIVISLLAVIWLYNDRYDDCMREKNDKYICEIYARGGN